MFKRLFWIGIGITLGIVVAAKARAYVATHTNDSARQFVIGPDQPHVTQRTLFSLVDDFKSARVRKEAELNNRFGSTAL